MTLTWDARDGVATITIARPEKRNALHAAAITTLAEICATLDAREDIRAVILTGSGGTFSAGGDIGAWSALSPAAFARHWVRDGHAAFDRLARLTQPVIAVLNGSVLGGGLELAAAADYRIAETQATLAMPETALGIIPGWSGTQRAVRRFGAQTVRRMALFGEVFDAETAAALGLVDQVVATGKGMTAAETLASAVTNRAPGATALVKMLVNAAEGEERERVLEAMAGQIAAGSEELASGLQRFRSKKKGSDT